MNKLNLQPFSKQSNHSDQLLSINNNNNNNLNKQQTTKMTTTTNVKYEHLVAGISGGVASTLALHPLDLLKIRLAVNDGQLSTRPQYTGLINAVTTIFKQEGFRGFYRGVTPNCWGAGSSWGFYFLFYNAIKSRMSNVGDVQQINLHAGHHILAASEAGIMTLVLTNPIWVVKTRLCLQYGGMNNENAIQSTKRYNGMIDALKKIYRYEGIRGLYRGFVPGIFGVSHGALQFMAYEELKRYYSERYGLRREDRLGIGAYLCCSALSKLFAAIITYPYQVVRARLQDQYANYNGVIDVIRRTWRYESLRGFYKGFAAYILHVTPNICIVFLIYEKFTRPSNNLVIPVINNNNNKLSLLYPEQLSNDSNDDDNDQKKDQKDQNDDDDVFITVETSTFIFDE